MKNSLIVIAIGLLFVAIIATATYFILTNTIASNIGVIM
jgi:hypothetical protein